MFFKIYSFDPTLQFMFSLYTTYYNINWIGMYVGSCTDIALLYCTEGSNFTFPIFYFLLSIFSTSTPISVSCSSLFSCHCCCYCWFHFCRSGRCHCPSCCCGLFAHTSFCLLVFTCYGFGFHRLSPLIRVVHT